MRYIFFFCFAMFCSSLVPAGDVLASANLVAEGLASVEELPLAGFRFKAIELRRDGITNTLSGHMEPVGRDATAGVAGHTSIRITDSQDRVVASAKLPLLEQNDREIYFEYYELEPFHHSKDLTIRLEQHADESSDFSRADGQRTEISVESLPSDDFVFYDISIASNDSRLTVSGYLEHRHGRAPHIHHGHLHVDVIDTNGKTFASAAVPYRRGIEKSSFYKFRAVLSGVAGGQVRLEQHAGHFHEANGAYE